MSLDLTPNGITSQAQHLWPLVIPGLIHLVEAGVILVAGIWLSGKAEYFTRKLLARTHRFDEMLQGFFGNISRYFVLVITGLTVLAQFGVQTASLVAVIGAASLAIGLALQGTLSNLAAGVMLLIFRPFRLGHHIQVAGQDGTVRELTLFWTEIVTDANVQVLIPNSSVWGTALKNLTTYAAPAERLSARFPLPVGQDLAGLRAKLLPVVRAVEKVAATPEPEIMFDRASADNTLLLYVKFTPKGDEDESRSAVIEAVEHSLHPLQAA